MNYVTGCFCVYSNFESFEYIRDSLEKTLLSNLEQEDRLPFQGLPIVILFVADSLVEENEMMKLREEGQSLADRYVVIKWFVLTVLCCIYPRCLFV